MNDETMKTLMEVSEKAIVDAVGEERVEKMKKENPNGFTLIMTMVAVQIATMAFQELSKVITHLHDNTDKGQ